MTRGQSEAELWSDDEKHPVTLRDGQKGRIGGVDGTL